MIKLIASDLDGTLLLNGAQELNPEIYDIILELKKHGVLFTTASGRQLASQQNLFRPIADEISYITENGAICMHDGEIFTTCEIDRDLAFRIIHCVEQKPSCKLMVSCISACYIQEDETEFIDHVRYVVKNEVKTIASFDDIQEPIFKIAYYDVDGYMESMKYFQDCFPAEINVVTSGNFWVDFVPLDSNKGTALQILLDKIGITPEETISFGDQQNDVEMLKVTGKSYVLSHAASEIKQYADAVTDSVEETLRKIIKTLE